MPDALYDIAVRLGLDVSGFSLAARTALDAFTGLETAATRANAAVDRFGPRLQVSMGQLERSAGRVQSAFDATQASLTRLTSAAGAPASVFQSAQDAHLRNLTTLGNAQERLATQQDRYNALLGQQAAATTKAAEANNQLKTAMQGVGIIAGAGAIGAVGGIMGGWLGESVQQATDLQTVLTQIGQTLTTSKTATTVAGLHLDPTTQAAAMAALQRQALTVGQGVGMSQLSMAEVIRAATRAGMTQPDVLLGPNWQKGNFRGGIVPNLATFSQLLNLSRGYTPDQSATVATEFAHLLGAWQPTLFNQMTDLLGRALMVSPATPEQFLTTSRQLASTIRPLYGNSQQGQQRLINDVLTATALEQEMGIGERGGTELARLITRTLGGNTRRSSVQNDALDKIQRVSGIQFFDAQGQFTGVAKVIEAMAKVAATETPYDAEKLFQAAFMQVGGRQAGILSTNVTLNRLKTLSTMFDPKTGLPTTRKAMDQLLNTPQGQQYVAQQEWQNLGILIGTQVIPQLTKAYHLTNSILKSVIDFTSHNSGILRFAAAFMGVGAAAAAVIAPLGVLTGSVMLLTGATGLEGLTAALGTVGIALGVFAAGVGAFALLFADWHDVMKVIGGDISHMSLGAAALAESLASLFAPFLTFIDLLRQAYDIWQQMFGKPHPPAIPTTGKPHPEDVWQNGEWMRPHVINGQRILLPDTSGKGGKGTGHTLNLTQNIHITAGAEAHHIAATTKKAAHDGMMAALGALSSGFAMDANYGPTTPFTSNPTMRSGGW